MPTRGNPVSDIRWGKGFFLKTFPELFICNSEHPHGGDISFISKPVKYQKWYQ